MLQKGEWGYKWVSNVLDNVLNGVLVGVSENGLGVCMLISLIRSVKGGIRVCG